MEIYEAAGGDLTQPASGPAWLHLELPRAVDNLG
jgi:hypothetical protein